MHSLSCGRVGLLRLARVLGLGVGSRGYEWFPAPHTFTAKWADADAAAAQRSDGRALCV